MIKRKLFFIIIMSLLLACSSGQEKEGQWSLDRVATMIDEGASVQLTLRGEPPLSLNWTSGNEAVARVNANGEVKGISSGDAWITARSPLTGAADSCLVTVGYLPRNPILPPSWELLIADGEPHVFDGRMYIFGSRDNYDGYGDDGKREWCSDNYHVIWSDDLLHWNDAGEALNLKDIPQEVKGDGIRLWAPDVFKDPITGKYHMLSCTNNGKVFILDGDCPEGPYVNARTVTLNGEELGHIDPGALVDDDGKVYLVLPEFIIAQLDPEDFSRIIPESVRDMKQYMPSDNEPFEGPSLRKRGDTYYYIYIQNHGKKADGWLPTRMAYLTADEPLGPYTYRGLIVTNQDYPYAGNIHGSFECFDGNWYVQYHRSIPGLTFTREACLDPLEFNPDGSIREVKMTSSGVRGAFLPGDRIDASSAVEYSTGRSGGLTELRRGKSPVVSFTSDGQWTLYRYVDFSRPLSRFTARVRSTAPGGLLEIRKASPGGSVIASIEIPDTGGEWEEISVPATAEVSGKDAVCLLAAHAPFQVESFLFSTHLPAGESGYNPICPMGVYMADPSAKVIDGKLYVACSLDLSPDYWCSHRHHMLSTGDMLHWTLHPDVFASRGVSDEVPYSDADLYAPDIAERGGKYYLYYDLSEWTEGVAVADSPVGPFRDGRLIEGIRGIDPCVFIDDDGEAYYFWDQFSAKGAKLNPDMTTLDMSTLHEGIVTEDRHFFHEGSFVFKRDGWYYYVYADISRQNMPTCLGYSMSRSVFGPYEYKGVIIDSGGCDPDVWNNHGSVVEFGGQWYVLYHRSTHHSSKLRKACIEPITFNADGTINEVEMTSQGAGKPIPATSVIDAARACLFNGGPHIRLETPDREILSGVVDGSKAAWKYVDFGPGITKMKIRVRTLAGGRIGVHQDQPFYGEIASFDVRSTKGEWVTLECDVKSYSEGPQALWFTFSGQKGAPSNQVWLLDIDWFKFE